jgi:hypothetical protein
MNPIFYYKHPFSLPRGGHLATGWKWVGSVCFCHHSNVPELFSSQECNRNFTLVSEAADMGFHDNDTNDALDIGFPHKPSIYSIPRSKIPIGLQKWYSTNVNLKNPEFRQGQNIECCPIGVYEGYTNNFELTGDLNRRIAKITDKEILCLMNFSINNRQERFELFRAAQSCDWITSYQNSHLSYQDIINDIGCSKFVICPISNGIETSRVWESIYLGAIPIMIQNHWADSFNTLPFIKLQSWSELNKPMLEAAWNKFLAKKQEYCYNIVDANYWTNKIRESI